MIDVCVKVDFTVGEDERNNDDEGDDIAELMLMT